ncbi:related to C6 transcription factor [Cephalotrichum gorgonifer]|uniref:Related to C6 transcription factor n=1 Tax=Cephalotrichum gorgonifer TaxID=2041049 RepID=A0AAE8MWN6_9PEZI|nr:related to C6 transcription factor [Cephalotrichum gorgonifer]
MNGLPSPRRTTRAQGGSRPVTIADVQESVAREHQYETEGDKKDSVDSEIVDRPSERVISTERTRMRKSGAGNYVGRAFEAAEASRISPYVNERLLSRPGTGDRYGMGLVAPTSIFVDQQHLPTPPSRPANGGNDNHLELEDPSPGNQLSDTHTPLSQQTEHAASHLISLSQTSPFSPSLGDQPSPELVLRPPHIPPTDSTEDGLFRPGSTYLNLHCTLRRYLFQESRSTGPTRCSTPCGGSDDTGLDVTYPSVLDEFGEGGEDEPTFVLTKEQERVLWVNWLEEVAPWLDKFDRNRTFQHSLSVMAKSHLHLKYSIMAVSARQVERKISPDNLKPASLALYQQAIHLLLPQLTTRSTPVIASCVVLCVLEMLTCSPKAWQRHLDGCATLLRAVGIHGFSGGLEEALFWCFARMDVAGGIISSVRTLIPVSDWTPHGDLRSAIALFRRSRDFGTYANQAVFLMAHVVDILASIGSDMTGSMLPYLPSNTDDFTERWKYLWSLIDEWYQLRPGEMHPVFTASITSTFPTILFSNPAAISGNQLYHTATVLMLQHKPRQISLEPKPRSILWHARRIVGISESNGHHGCWTNSLQPLWIAGKLFSSPEEHKVVLELLERIERQSGWATTWRAQDLKEWWGDLGD